MSKLHLVFGGRVTDPMTLDFQDPTKLDVVGIFPDYASAEKAWRGAAQRTVDDAEMKYVVVHLHRLMEPDQEALAPPYLIVTPALCRGPPRGERCLSGSCAVRAAPWIPAQGRDDGGGSG